MELRGHHLPPAPCWRVCGKKSPPACSIAPGLQLALDGLERRHRRTSSPGARPFAASRHQRDRRHPAHESWPRPAGRSRAGAHPAKPPDDFPISSSTSSSGARGKRDVHVDRLFRSLLTPRHLPTWRRATPAEPVHSLDHRREQQRRRGSARAEHAGRRRRSHRLARRTGRDRRILPHPRRDGEVGRNPARSRHHQPHPRRRLRKRHHRTHAAAAARASLEFRNHRIHRTGIHRRTGHARARARPALDGRPGQRRARRFAEFRHQRRAQRARQPARRASTSSPTAATNCWAGRKPD